jgi:hypothetical protein
MLWRVNQSSADNLFPPLAAPIEKKKPRFRAAQFSTCWCFDQIVSSVNHSPM